MEGGAMRIQLVNLFLFYGIRFELKASFLQSRCLQSRYPQSRHSTAGATTPVHFVLVILEMGF
jgi:hypothetical protein